jgi:DNA end-binding protein Ku
MAPRANWKGYLRLSLVSCPVALFPATSDQEKVHFHRINRKTGHRVHMINVDATTDEPVDREDLGRGYEISKNKLVEIEPEELEAVEINSARVIEIDEFVPKTEIDELYYVRPYYVVPQGEVGIQAFNVIRKALEEAQVVAISRVVLTNREHIIALEPRGKGLVGMLLRYPYEVRDEADFFDDIPASHVTKDMVDLAQHIVKTKMAHFQPEKFKDRYEEALRKLVKRKAAGETIEAPEPEKPSNVINLMDALRESVNGDKSKSAKAAPRRASKKPGRKKRAS